VVVQLLMAAVVAFVVVSVVVADNTGMPDIVEFQLSDQICTGKLEGSLDVADSNSKLEVVGLELVLVRVFHPK